MAFMIKIVVPSIGPRWITAVAVLSLAALCGLGDSWSLIDRLTPLMIAAGLITFPWGIWLSFHFRLIGQMRDSRLFAIHMGVALLFGICGILVVRDVVEAAAFIGANARSTVTTALVLDHHSTQRGTRKAFLLLAEGVKREVPITPELYDVIDRPHTSGDCLSLRQETGRWGLRRVRLPRPLIDQPFGVERYVSCPQRQNW